MSNTKQRLKRAVLTVERVMEAIENDDYPGFCMACGEQAYSVEPDATAYECESCGAHQVYGAEEILLMGWAR